MKKTFATILASALYFFPLQAQPLPNKSVIVCPERKGDISQLNISQLEKELAAYKYKLYSHSAPPGETKLFLIGFDPLRPDPNLALVLARYVQSNDVVLVEGQQKGEDLRAKLADIPALRCLPGQKLRAYGATPDLERYKGFLETLEIFDPSATHRTAFEAVIHAKVMGSRRIQEEEYSKLIREYAGKPQGRVYAVIDYEYATNGRFTLNLKRAGIKFAAVSPRHEMLEQMAGERIESVNLTIRAGQETVTLPYNNFAVRGAPLTLMEALVINTGKVEYAGGKKTKYESDDGKIVSLSKGKPYHLADKEIIWKE